MSTRAPRPSSQAPTPSLPRASDVALARRVSSTAVPPLPGPGPRRWWSRHAARSAAAVVAIVALLLSDLAVSPLAAAQRQADPVAPVIPAAEGDPTPTPSLQPTPSPSPTPRPTPWPTPKGVKGVDVSHWNGEPDFDQLHAEGMRFVFSKASQGLSFVDDTYRRNTRDARAAGLYAGAYHFFDYRKGGKAQARHYLATIKATTGLSGLLPLVVDVETLSSLGTPDRTAAKLRLHALLDELYARTGRYPMIYTSRFMWDQVVGGATSFGRYPLWVACWKCDTIHLPRGWSGWDFWQVGQFRFQSGKRLDGNAWRSTASKLQAQRQRNMRLARGAAWTSSRSVDADLRGYDGSHVRYANGDEPFGSWQPYSPRLDLRLSEQQGQQDLRVQLRSFRGVRSPILRDSISLDSVPPAMWGPRVSLRQGVRVARGGARVPVVVDMGARDATSGLASTRLAAACDGRVLRAKAGAAARPRLAVQLDSQGCRLTGRATDAVGLRSARSLSPSVRLLDLRRSNRAVTFVSGWSVNTGAEALGKTLARASRRNATVKVRIEGAQFAVVARRGPAGGRLAVIVDGQEVDTIDLYAKSGDARRVVYVRNVPRGTHVVKLRATGTGRAASTGTTVWLDALLVLDRRK